MKKTFRFDSKQFFSIVVLFELGSAILVGLGMQAGRDSWLAVLLGLAVGILLYLIYMYLFNQFPELTLTQMFEVILGKFLGKMFGTLYALYFLYLAARVLRDFGSLLLSAVFVQTPMVVVNALMIVTVIYVLLLGLEVLLRSGQIFFGVLFIMSTLLVVFTLTSNIMDINYLKPVLGEGWTPVLKTVFPLTASFPFGEMIVFLMILPSIKTKSKALSVGLIGMIFSGILLSATSAMNIAVLGGHVATHVFFPLLSTVAKINLGEFIQRLDALVVFTLITGGFFKISVYLYAGVRAAKDVFEVKEINRLFVPMGIVVLLSSIMIAANFVEHINEGLQIVPFYIHIPFQMAIPVFLILVYWLRKSKIKQDSSSSSTSS